MKTRLLSLIVIFILNITIVFAQTGKKEKFEVAGNCDMGKTRIENTAKSVDGVSSAEWNKESKILEVTYDSTKIKIDKVHRAIAKAGHDTKLYKARDRAYDKLPACCQYERISEEDMLKRKRLQKIARVPAVGIQW